jgi:hypothetical protein
MRKHLLSDKGNFYKANLHVHTTVSDGDMTPEEIKRIYMEQGYSVVAFTDHEIMVPHPELTDGDFLAITSSEISVNQRLDCDFCYTRAYHLNIYSPEESRDCFRGFDKSKLWFNHSDKFITPEQERMNEHRVYTVDCINDFIKRANDDGCLVSYNHPVWSLQDYSDYCDLKGLWGIEVYNTACARNAYLDDTKPMDDLLRKGERVAPLATDDAHKLCDCFGGFTMIRAENLSYDSVFTALKNGDFYASTGPRFHEISIEDGVLKIVCSPVSFVAMTTDCRYTFVRRSQTDTLTEIEFNLHGYLDMCKNGVNEHKYIRLMLTDSKGQSAFSRAFFVDELLGC